MIPLVLLLATIGQTASVRGYVRADSTAEPIAYATVAIPALGRTAAADAHGFYVIPGVRQGLWTIRASAIGYHQAEKEISIPTSGTFELNFRLSVQPVNVSPLAVRAEHGSTGARLAGPDALLLDTRTLRLIPGLAEADVLRAAQILPSVQTISDFSSALYIRGGAPDQTLLILDGAPIFNPYHLGGIFSAINPGAVAGVEVFPGALPANIGDRLSGAVRIRTRDGGRDRTRGYGAIGLISARVGFDGPLPGGNGSYLVSLRRTYLDLFSDAAHALNLIDSTIPYGFTDAHLKLTHDVGALGRLSASAYLNSEELRNRSDAHDRLSWGSSAMSLKYRQAFGGAWLGQVTTAFSQFGSNLDFREELVSDSIARTADLNVRMDQALVSASLKYYATDYQLGFGAKYSAYHFDYRIRRDEDFFIADLFPRLRYGERLSTLAVYLRNNWSPNENTSIRAGVRALYAAEIGTAWLPRMGAEIEIHPSITLHIGAGRYAQAVHSLRNNASSAASFLAYDLLGAVPETGLQTAEDVVLGIKWKSGDTFLRVNLFTKWMHDLLLPPLPAEPLEAPVIVSEGFRRGEGRAHGLEILLRHEVDQFGVQGTYALNFVTRSAGNQVGESFSPRFERRHTLDIMGMYRTNGSILSARLVAASEQPFTPVTAVAQPLDYNPLNQKFATDGRLVYVLGEYNSGRLPLYWRLDVSARMTFDKNWFGQQLTLTPYIQILNVLNAHNVVFAQPAPYGKNAGNAGVIKYTPQLPFLPTIGVEWEF